jgi:ribonuclease D
MSRQSTISTAMAAADRPVMVSSARHLQQCIEDWLDRELLGMDTEFVRERTWRAALGLVQVSDGETVWLVDPLRCGPLEPLAALLEQPTLTKVLHAPSEDLEVMLYATGTSPQPLFDTQTACAMLGQPLQMAYHKTAGWLFGIKVDKGETRSNWCKRPLRPAQLHYAALDVCLLPAMYRELGARLQDLGRDAWLEDECAQMVERARMPADPQQSWQRIRGAGKLDSVALAVLQALAKWRDQQAKRLDRARGFFVKDEALLTIARNQPDSLDALAALAVFSNKTLAAHGNTIIGLVTDTLDSGCRVKPPKALRNSQRKLVASMKQLVQQRADELSVEPALLASRRDLENIVLAGRDEPLPERFTGWRKAVITDELLALRDEAS